MSEGNRNSSVDTCYICRRPLTSAKSMAVKTGPVCLAHLGFSLDFSVDVPRPKPKDTHILRTVFCAVIGKKVEITNQSIWHITVERRRLRDFKAEEIIDFVSDAIEHASKSSNETTGDEVKFVLDYKEKDRSFYISVVSDRYSRENGHLQSITIYSKKKGHKPKRGDNHEK